MTENSTSALRYNLVVNIIHYCILADVQQFQEIRFNTEYSLALIGLIRTPE